MTDKFNENNQRKQDPFDSILDSFREMVFKELFSDQNNLEEMALSVLGPGAKEAEIIPLQIQSKTLDGDRIDELSFYTKEKGQKDCVVVVSFQARMNKTIEEELKKFLDQSLEKYHLLQREDNRDLVQEKPEIKVFSILTENTDKEV